ncbi:MAG: hypothetical protein Q9213_004259 [Squamulea squamosa]
MEVETAALIRAAEDILSLTRTMKEMWLFGKLETVGTNEAEKSAEKSARGKKRTMPTCSDLSGHDVHASPRSTTPPL